MAPGRSTHAVLAGLCGGLLLAACSGAPPVATPPLGTATPVPPGTATPTATPVPASPSPAPSPLAACPTTPTGAAGLPVLWRGGSPDDLATAADGALWISDGPAGAVRRLAGGAVTRTIRNLSEPEGVIPLPGGDVVVAEQGRQRILVVHPDDSRTVLLTLPSAGSQLGVDGIAWDPRAGRVVVPDSPHGTVLSVPLDQPGAATTLASGLPRVVGAEIGTNGTGMWLAAEAEAPHGLLHLDGSGTATTVGSLVQLDDVVLAGPLLYVTDLRNRSVHAVDPTSGADRVIATGFTEPQGLALLPDGGLAVADSPRGVVQRITPCPA